MRPRVLAYFCLFSCVAFAAYAQEQEEDIAKRLQTRNANLAPTLFQNKTYITESKFNGTRSANVSTFYYIDHVRTKEFSTHPLYGVNKYWFGDSKYDTKAADLSSRNAIPNASKVFETKASETKTARESNKESATRTYADTHEYRRRGASQDRLDREGPDAFKGPVPLGLQGDMHQLTIDEVRDLLNKSK